MIKQEKFYKINLDKLREKIDTLPYFLGILGYSEDYMYFDKIKHLLIIPEEPKSIEELSQELDEKFEELLVKTKRKFAVSKETAEYYYNQKFRKINDDFEYIKEWGSLPRFTLTEGGILTNSNNYFISNSASSLSWSTEFRIGNGDAGYYTDGVGLRISMPKKPNMIVRTFMRICLGFKWVNKK